MMHKLWLKKLKLNYNNDVVDIVQFGSSVVELEFPNDIDIAVIFKKIPIKEQLEESQKIKKQLQKETSLPIHIKSFDLYSLLDASNFAKASILITGKSLISKDYFFKKFGIEPRIQIFYSLGKKEKREKVKFNYLLKGKKEKYGLLRKYGGKLLKPGLIEISPEHEKVFVSNIKKEISTFEIKKIGVLI